MPHTKYKIAQDEAFSLNRVSSVTGNPILDVGYQCSDMIPYFTYSNERGDVLYTKTHPSKDGPVRVYEINTISLDESIVYYGSLRQIQYNKATLLTNQDVENKLGIQEIISITNSYDQTIESATITIMDIGGETTLTCARVDGQFPHINVRIFNINKWSRYKPISGGDYNDIDNNFRKLRNDGLYEIKKQGTPDLFFGFHGYWYVTPESEDWKRLTDFSGYNHKAKCPIKDIRALIPETWCVGPYRTGTGTGITSVINISPDSIFDYSENVEFELSDLISTGYNQNNCVVGLYFSKVDSPYNGLLYTTDWILRDTAENTLQNWQGRQIGIDGVNWDSGDEIEVRAVAVSPSGTENTADLNFVPSNGYIIQFLCLDKNVGYAKFKYAGYVWNGVIRMNVNNSIANFDISGKLSNLNISLQDIYAYKEGERSDLYFKIFAVIGNNTTASTQGYIYKYGDYNNDFLWIDEHNNTRTFDVGISLQENSYYDQDDDGWASIQVSLMVYNRDDNDNYTPVFDNEKQLFSGFIYTIAGPDLGKFYYTNEK